MNPAQWISKILGVIALRNETARKTEVLRKDRLNCPLELAELEGIPLNRFMMKKVWSVSGNPYNKLKRDILIPDAEEVKKFVGHVFHEDGSPDDPHLLSVPIILSSDRDILVDMMEAPLEPLKIDPKEIVRQTWALVTLDMGWALPTRGGRIDRPPLPWRYLLHPEDYDRIVGKNSFSFWLALGYRVSEKMPQKLFTRPDQ